MLTLFAKITDMLEILDSLRLSICCSYVSMRQRWLINKLKNRIPMKHAEFGFFSLISLLHDCTQIFYVRLTVVVLLSVEMVRLKVLKTSQGRLLHQALPFCRIS